MQVSRYESVAQSFLNDHPLGTVVTSSALLKWSSGLNGDGGAIKADLAIEDPAKRISALRRHINNGAVSDNFAEDSRFVLQVEDTKRKTFVVRAYSEVVEDQAKGAILKSVSGALSPLKASKKAIGAVKLEELPEIERQAIEIARDNIEAMERAVKPTMAQEVERVWVTAMERYGIPADQARKIRQALPQVQKLQKLLRATA